MDDKTEIESDQYFKEFRSSEKLPRPPRGRKRLDNPHDPFNNILTEIENTLLGVSALREGVENPNADEIENKLDKTIAKIENDISKCLNSLNANTAQFRVEKLKNALTDIEVMDHYGGYTYSIEANALRRFDESELNPHQKEVIAIHDLISGINSKFIGRIKDLFVPNMECFWFFDNLTSIIEFDNFFNENKGKQPSEITFSDRKRKCIVPTREMLLDLADQGREKEIWGSFLPIDIYEFIIKEKAHQLKKEIELSFASLKFSPEKRAFIKQCVFKLSNLSKGFEEKARSLIEDEPNLPDFPYNRDKSTILWDIGFELESVKRNLEKSHSDLFIIPYKELIGIFKSEILYITARKQQLSEIPLRIDEKSPEDRLNDALMKFLTENYSTLLNTWLYEKEEAGTLFTEHDFITELKTTAKGLLIKKGDVYIAPSHFPKSLDPRFGRKHKLSKSISTNTYEWYEKEFRNVFLLELEATENLLSTGHTIQAAKSEFSDLPIKPILIEKEKANLIIGYLLTPLKDGSTRMKPSDHKFLYQLQSPFNKQGFFAALYHILLDTNSVLAPKQTERNAEIICQQFNHAPPDDFKYYQRAGRDQPSVKKNMKNLHVLKKTLLAKTASQVKR